MSENQSLYQLTRDQMDQKFAGQQTVTCYARLASREPSFGEEPLPTVEYEGEVTLLLGWGKPSSSGLRHSRRRNFFQAEPPPLIEEVSVHVPAWSGTDRQWVEYLRQDIEVDGTMHLDGKQRGWLMELFSTDGEGEQLVPFETHRARMHQQLIGAIQDQWAGLGLGVTALSFVGPEGTAILPLPQVSLVRLRYSRVSLDSKTLAQLFQQLDEISRQLEPSTDEKRTFPLRQLVQIGKGAPLELTVEVHASLAPQFREAIHALPDIEIME